MKKEDLAKLSKADLKSRLVTLQTITWTLIGVLALLIGLTTYNTIKKGEFDVTMIVGVSLLAILPLQFKQIKDIKVAMKNREN